MLVSIDKCIKKSKLKFKEIEKSMYVARRAVSGTQTCAPDSFGAFAANCSHDYLFIILSNYFRVQQEDRGKPSKYYIKLKFMAHYHGRQTGYQTWPLRNYFCSFYPFELKGWQNFVFQTIVCLFFLFFDFNGFWRRK